MLRKFLTVFTVMGMSLLAVNVDTYGDRGFDKVVWQAEPIKTDGGQALKLTYLSSDGEEDYPVNLQVTAIDTLTNYDELKWEMTATTDKPTPVNLVNHYYGNLAGHDRENILGQYLTLNAKQNNTKQNNLGEILAPNAELEKVASGFRFTEGPVWHPDGFLLFSDIPANTIYKWQPGEKPEIFRQPSGNANGNTLDKSGRLVSAEHGNRRVSLTEKNGEIVTIASQYQGKQLNSPNDLVVKSDGSIYFTDPPYGIDSEQEELGFYGVYHLALDGTLTLLVDDFVRPNGIALSPDETKLYVNDSQEGHIRVFDVQPDGMLDNGKLFAELKSPGKKGAADGMKVDIKGNVYSTAPGGVWIFSPNGDLLGIIETPEPPANIAWGDRDYQTLYITAKTSIYRIPLKIPGMR